MSHGPLGDELPREGGSKGPCSWQKLTAAQDMGTGKGLTSRHGWTAIHHHLMAACHSAPVCQP